MVTCLIPVNIHSAIASWRNSVVDTNVLFIKCSKFQRDQRTGNGPVSTPLVVSGNNYSLTAFHYFDMTHWAEGQTSCPLSRLWPLLRDRTFMLSNHLFALNVRLMEAGAASSGMAFQTSIFLWKLGSPQIIMVHSIYVFNNTGRPAR